MEGPFDKLEKEEAGRFSMELQKETAKSIEDSVRSLFYMRKKGMISPEQFRGAVAQLFEVEDVIINEKKNDKDETEKLELKDEKGKVLFFLDLKEADRLE
ncbi:MAG: hypothetical protein Q8Q06_03330 [bacterium]|nr:hypothetical protein [bacterium]